jgi:hypothetical protein
MFVSTSEMWYYEIYQYYESYNADDDQAGVIGNTTGLGLAQDLAGLGSADLYYADYTFNHCAVHVMMNRCQEQAHFLKAVDEPVNNLFIEPVKQKRGTLHAPIGKLHESEIYVHPVQQKRMDLAPTGRGRENGGPWIVLAVIE